MMLLRVQMPDLPGSLGKVATAIASTGADIASIRIVGRDADGLVVDDFVCALPPGALADSLVSAFDQSIGARVLWISRCPDQWDLMSEAELIGEMVQDAEHGRELLFEHLPSLFHCQWMALGDVRHPDHVVVTDHAPELTFEQLAALGPLDELHAIDLPADWAPGWGEVIAAVVPNRNGRFGIMARQGGPEFLNSELRRLSGLFSLVP